MKRKEIITVVITALILSTAFPFCSFAEQQPQTEPEELTQLEQNTVTEEPAVCITEQDYPWFFCSDDEFILWLLDEANREYICSCFAGECTDGDTKNEGDITGTAAQEYGEDSECFPFMNPGEIWTATPEEDRTAVDDYLILKARIDRLGDGEMKDLLSAYIDSLLAVNEEGTVTLPPGDAFVFPEIPYREAVIDRPAGAEETESGTGADNMTVQDEEPVLPVDDEAQVNIEEPVPEEAEEETVSYKYSAKSGLDRKTDLIAAVREIAENEGTVFVSSADMITDCAREAGLLDYGEFILTDDPDSLFTNFAYIGDNKWKNLEDVFITPEEPESPEPWENAETNGRRLCTEEQPEPGSAGITETGGTDGPEEETPEIDLSGYIGDLIFFTFGNDGCYLSWKRQTQMDMLKEKAYAEIADTGTEDGTALADYIKALSCGQSFTGVGMIIDTTDTQLIYATADTEGKCVLNAIDALNCPEACILVPVEYKDYDEHLVDCLRSYLGYNDAVISGILANMYCESGFQTGITGDNGTSFGLCQWHNERWESLADFAEENGWDTASVKTQVLFLLNEMRTDFPLLHQYLLRLSNDTEGAFAAGYAFCIEFEQPQYAEQNADYRGELAVRSFLPLITGMNLEMEIH